MKLSELLILLPSLKNVSFKLENGTEVPSHFHVTEVGINSKFFIDCGGIVRVDKKITLQLWAANDIDHQLTNDKFLDILNLSIQKLNIVEDAEIEVEYQGINTIEKYSLAHNGVSFVLTNLQTACLAEDFCGIPTPTSTTTSCCTPGGGCC